MEYPTPAPLCPICSRALEISTSEPHPTRNRVDVLTYRCSIHGDIWTRPAKQKSNWLVPIDELLEQVEPSCKRKSAPI
jgi:hypothetical protein